MANIEEKIAELEATVAQLQHDLLKEKAVTEICNLIGRYVYLHTGNEHDLCEELFAEGDPDLSIEIGPMGLYRGPDAAYKVYHLVHNATGSAKDPHPGSLFVHTLASPIVQVADDLETAKGLWMSPGFETAVGPDGKPFCGWTWGEYGCDFKKINGVWKIWHLHFYAWFSTSVDVPWTQNIPGDRMPEDPNRPPMPEAMRPNYPTTYFNEYATDKCLPYWPQAPLPYEHYAEGEQRMVGAPDGWVQPPRPKA